MRDFQRRAIAVLALVLCLASPLATAARAAAGRAHSCEDHVCFCRSTGQTPRATITSQTPNAAYRTYWYTRPICMNSHPWMPTHRHRSETFR